MGHDLSLLCCARVASAAVAATADAASSPSWNGYNGQSALAQLANGPTSVTTANRFLQPKHIGANMWEKP